MKNKIRTFAGISILVLSTIKLGTHPAFLFLAIGLVSMLYRSIISIKRRVRS